MDRESLALTLECRAPRVQFSGGSQTHRQYTSHDTDDHQLLCTNTIPGRRTSCHPSTCPPAALRCHSPCSTWSEWWSEIRPVSYGHHRINKSSHSRVFELSLALLVILLSHDLRLHVVPLVAHRRVVIWVVLPQHNVRIILEVVQVLVLQGDRAEGNFACLYWGNGQKAGSEHELQVEGWWWGEININ